ncbi:AAA family ATPase [Streptomyces sp. NPDC016845]|uniref:AAA family ATPase n=1 Tax=Streptomyces sp. NPDC016845 TaxID=3364972 RepID=UPI00378C9AB8
MTADVFDHGSASASAEGWGIYRGTGVPRPDGIDALPPPPPWRTFDGGPVHPGPPEDADETRRRLGTHTPTVPGNAAQLDIINAALCLRRPLLVTGRPGSGKSTLPYQIAHELRLGRVLYWPVTSRTTLQDGLYTYDAIGRVQATATWRATLDVPGGAVGGPVAEGAPPVGDFLGLGPLGTALLPYERPRVLLVDELDKSDIDLPNDLLSVLEEGTFGIPELARSEARSPSFDVHTDDPGVKAPVWGGRVRCRAFPIVVITSNGEREFPPAFLRRCLRLDIPQPGVEELAAMVAAHFSVEVAERARAVIAQFHERSARSGGLAADQLLNAVHLMTAGDHPARGEQWDDLMAAVWRRLSDY